MKEVNTITRLKAILCDINDKFYFEEWDGDSEEGQIIRKVCILDRQNEELLDDIKSQLVTLISDIAESESDF